MFARLTHWLSSTLTGKFIFLLIGFLLLQALQLGIGIYGIVHLGEQAALLDKAGRQRMHTLLLLEGARAAVAARSWEESARQRFLERIAEQDRMLELLSKTFGERPEPPVLMIARAHWQKVLAPQLRDIAQHPVAQDLTHLPDEVSAHLEHLNALVALVAQRVRHQALALAVFQLAVLTVGLLLGLVGLGMARYIVTRPLRRLIEAARAIATGDYGRRLTVSSRDEVGELAQTFNEMAEAIARKTAGIQALNEVAVSLSASLDLQSLVAMILKEAQRLGGVRGVVLVLDEPTQAHPAALQHQRGLIRPEQVELLQRLAQRAWREGDRIEQTADGETYLCLPLATRDRREGLQGVLCFVLSASPAAERDEGLYYTFAALSAEALANARAHARVLDEAASDPLTGLVNRRALDERLQQEWDRAQRSGQPFSVLLLDIDHFKRINDHYGHAVGDAVLVHLAGILREEIRGFDLAARYGGEEFVVLLPATEGEAARAVAERIRRAIARTPFLLPDGQEIALTVSIGIASYSDSVPDVTTLLLHADQALYTAKVAGRNRVVLYRDMLKSELERHPERLVEMLKENLANIEPIVTAISAKAGFYHAHTALVVQTGERLAQALGLSREDREQLRLAALLHDVGMLAVPDAVLNKTNPLSEEEWVQLRAHPLTAARWLEQVPALAHLAPIVRHHHERYDGTGYPDGLAGEAIPYLARVLAVADAYAALVADWPGHQGTPHEQAKAELEAGAGKQFDPKIAGALLKVLAEEATNN